MQKQSDYAKHLKEKQKARIQAQIGEAQFKRFFCFSFRCLA